MKNLKIFFKCSDSPDYLEMLTTQVLSPVAIMAKQTLRQVMPATMRYLNKGTRSLSSSTSAQSDKPSMMVNYSGSTSIFETLTSLTKHGLNINYPQIVCVGNQSSGKTSLTEAMCGINGLFEKKTGMATRRPTSISLIKTAEGEDYIQIGHLGQKTSNIDKARQRLVEENDGEVTDKPLDVIIYSPKIQKECQFIDLPGFIRATKLDEDSTLPAKIRKICKPYIENSNNIKMVVMSATEDAASSEGLAQIIKHQQLATSMAVFTKIDMITNDRIKTRALMGLLTDRAYIPHLGAVGVKLRSQSDLDAGTTIEQMLKNEADFIDYYKLKDSKVNVGIPRLMELISTEQIKRISYCFPAIKEQIHKALAEKRNGHAVIRKLAETDDIHGISVELERIVTDLHPRSSLRVKLEWSIKKSIHAYVKAFVMDHHKFGEGGHKFITVPEKISLARVRGLFNDKINPDQSSANRFSDHLLYGECNDEISIPELERAMYDSFAKSQLGAFIQVMHPIEAISGGDDKYKYNRVQFTRDISQLVTSMSSPDFTKAVINLTTSAIKDAIIQNSKSHDQNGIAELFFVHIAEKVTEESNIDDLRRSISQMILREKRPYIEYDDLVSRSYNHIRQYNKQLPSATHSPGFFEKDVFPVGLDLYSPQMKDAYIDAMIDRVATDIFRSLSEHLLNHIIAKTIEQSFKTIKKKDFSKEEKGINDAIQQLEKQLETVDAMIGSKV